MSIILAFHILLGMGAIAASSIAAVRPKSNIIQRSSELLAATVISGTALLFTGASLVHVCVSGLTVSIVALSLIFVANRRLNRVVL